jgi:hypothetical protein
MKKNLILLAALLLAYPAEQCFSQTAPKAPVAASVVGRNKHMVFATSPITSDKPVNATQKFKGTDFIYARIFFSSPVKEMLFLDTTAEGTAPVGLFVEDVTNHKSIYLAFDINNDEINHNAFSFDILPNPDNFTRPGKEFETGRLSNLITEESLEKKLAVFKFTYGDAVGYIQVDFRNCDLKAIVERDKLAYDKSKVEKQGEETK